MSESLQDTLIVAATFAIVLAVAFGIAYWTYRAASDRSARVGLYLVLGFPGALLAIWGLARIASSKSSGEILLAVGLGMALPLVSGFRRTLARFLPFDPESSIDMVGLAALLAVGGFLAASYALDPEPGETETVEVAELVSQFVSLSVLAYVLVGVGIWRTFPEATRRLGLTWPTWKQLGVGVGGFLAGFVVMIIAGVLTQVFQPGFDEEIQEATRDITENVSNPVGAVFFGLGAGISEELLLRGAIQPRFGLLPTSLFFMLLHGQYGLSFVQAGVFGMGLVMGLQRKYFGTTSAVITHAIFNTISVLLST